MEGTYENTTGSGLWLSYLAPLRRQRSSAYRASRLACRRCPLDRMWPWIAVA
jgi:hypothetical protein